MKLKWMRLVLVMLLATALTPAFAQAPAPQPAGIDSGLLAKANAGDAASQMLVADAYAAGKGVSRDTRQAADWYRKAAEQGNVSAQLRLAALYRDGAKGFPRDMEQAAVWYRKAAEQGDTAAQGTLGVMYSMGSGVPHDDVEAYYWLDLAASVKGPNQAQYAANRQLIGTRITADEQAGAEDRVAAWIAAHPRPNSTE